MPDRRERKTLTLLTPPLQFHGFVTSLKVTPHVVWAAWSLEGGLRCVYSATRPIAAVVTGAQVICLCVFVPKVPRVSHGAMLVPRGLPCGRPQRWARDSM